jgi:hypothetical protein
MRGLTAEASSLGDEIRLSLVWSFGLTAAQLDAIASELYAIVSAPCQIGTTRFVVRPSIGIVSNKRVQLVSQPDRHYDHLDANRAVRTSMLGMSIYLPTASIP